MESYHSVDEIKFDPSDLFPIAQALDELQDVNEETFLDAEKKENVLSSVRVFVNNNFNFHNVFSVYRNSASYRMFKKHPKSTCLALPSIKNDMVLVDPLRLPVKFFLSDIGEGDVDYRVIGFRNTDLYICLGIDLPKEITTLTPSTYMHELVHTQLANCGTVRYPFNDELLSILMEFIYILEAQENTRLYRSDKVLRIKDFIYRTGVIAAFNAGIAEYDSDIQSESIKYSVSTLQAFHLLTLYEAGDFAYKSDMLKNIQKIFDRRIMVEDFLDMYQINLSSMLDLNKVLRFAKK